MTEPAAWTDAHCHLQDRYLRGEEDAAPADLAGVAERALAAGVSRAIVVGTDVATSRAAMDLAGQAGLGLELWATVGLHPHEAARTTEGLRELLEAPGSARVVGIGECGLDYYYEHSPRPAQLEALADQVRLAAERDLALVLHVRDAFDDLFGVLSETGVPERTVVHCFSGGPSEARRCLELGMVISISGIVTFKSADELREAVRLVPLDRLLVETDSPFLAPVPLRGRTNEPANVAIVGEAVAALVGVDPSALAAATSATATRVFKLSTTA